LAQVRFVPLSMKERIGAYEIVKLLGRGEMSSVYECRHAALGRLAAVKLLHPHLARDRAASARFLREGRALARVEHPNVVEVFDVGERDEVPYLVMTLVDGEDLEAHLRWHHPLSASEVADCILPIVSAVAAAYDAGIVHRDVKPSNIRMARDHRGTLMPKVLNFGISKLTGDEQGPKLADIDAMLATASYMSPEQLHSSNGQTSARGDVYTLGAILYQAIAGKRPFHGRDALDLMQAILTAYVAPPGLSRMDIPAALDGIAMRAMSRDPAERFASARELGLALSQFASDSAAWRSEFMARSGNRLAVARSTMSEPTRRFTR
jgi:eukaryotic-like serine/threonine-protein kinase